MRPCAPLGWTFVLSGGLVAPLMRSKAVEKGTPCFTAFLSDKLLGGLDRFADLLWVEGTCRQCVRALKNLIAGDGAPCIWNLPHDHFGSSRQVVDPYHANEHLYEVAHLARGEGSAKAIRWGKQMEDRLY